MARGRYVTPGMVEYKGYSIGLTDEGKIECAELGIVGDTLDDVKKAIRETEVKEAKLPMVDVWFQPNYHQFLILGKSNKKRVGLRGKYVWVSWKDEKGKSHREQVYVTSVYPDTAENRERVERVTYLKKAKSDLEDDIQEIMGQMEVIYSDGFGEDD